MNEYYRTIINENIKKGLKDASSASNINHRFLIGRLREIVLNTLLEPMLNNNYSMGTGKVIDYDGNLSKEIDICIYSKNLHPPIFFSLNDKLGIFPIESVLSCIEVKSSFSKKNIKDAYEKFSHLRSQLTMTVGVHDGDQACPQIIVHPHYRLFVFKCGIKNYDPESFLKFYKHIDPNWDVQPVIGHVCIAGKGAFCFTSKGWVHMEYNAKQDIHEEIISFLGTVIHDLPHTEHSRGIPRIGYYLTDTHQMDRLVDGKLLIRPWKPYKMAFRVTDLNEINDVSKSKL